MRRLWGILLAALISTGAHAQTTARIGYAADGNGSQPFTYVSSLTPLPVSGSFSAGSFAPGGNYATLTSTASSADAALPTGTTVALFNTGTSAVSCILSVGAGTATASKNVIQSNSWFAVVPGSNTHYSCINQAGDGASNVVVASGGSGLPAGAGGGGGGSGGAVTIASGGVASGAYASGALAVGSGTDGWNATDGAKADSACGTSTGTCSLIALLKYNNQQAATTATNTGAAVPAGTNLIGNVGGTVTPAGATQLTASATGTTAATTATLSGTSGKTTYICWMSIRANATAAATGNATVTGTITGTLNFTQWTAPLASGLGVTEMVFNPCVAASGTNQAIAVVSAAPGSGGVVSVSAGGFQM